MVLKTSRDGRWFHVAGFWVYPKHTLKEVELLPDEYGKQPKWHLRDIKASSRDEAKLIVADFLEAASHASANFCWPLAFDLEHIEWREHAWKHVTFRHLEYVAEDTNCPPVPELRLDPLTIAEIKELFTKAMNRDPGAVARLTHLFPDELERLRVARGYFGELPPEMEINGIPSADKLSDDYMRTIYRSPDSQEAEAAREDLRLLVSKKAIKGQRPGRGRAQDEIHQDTVRILYNMSSAIFMQVREVDQFLSEFEPSSENRGRLLETFYPWIARITGNNLSLLSLLEMQPTQAAPLISNLVLRLSGSKIEKTVYPKRRG